jgi:hypothetical protein
MAIDVNGIPVADRIREWRMHGRRLARFARLRPSAAWALTRDHRFFPEPPA